MLKTLSTKSAEPRKGIVGVNGGREEHCDRAEPVGKDEIDNSKFRDNKVRKKDQKMSKSKNLFQFIKLSKSKKTVRLDFFFLE